MVQIKDLNNILCNEFTGQWKPCDYLSMKIAHSECGDCPLNDFGEWYAGDYLLDNPEELRALVDLCAACNAHGNNC